MLVQFIADVGMLKILTSKKDILDVRNNYIPMSAKDFKDTVKSSFAERRKGKFGKHFRSVDPLLIKLYTKIIRQFVVGEGPKRIINIDTPHLVFPENIAKFQDFIQLINEENGTDRKYYIFIRFKSISS